MAGMGSVGTGPDLGGAAIRALSQYQNRPVYVAEDLWFANGSVITDDGVLMVDETFGHRVSAFDIEPDESLTNRRSWATFGELPTAWGLTDTLPSLVAPVMPQRRRGTGTRSRSAATTISPPKTAPASPANRRGS